jgi:hypothetical protein
MSARLKQGPHGYEILEYLVRHPQAGDTIEGIVEWWLLEQRIVHALEKAQTSLNELVARRLLLAHRALDGRTHYRLYPGKLEEVRQIVRSTRRPGRKRPGAKQ